MIKKIALAFSLLMLAAGCHAGGDSSDTPSSTFECTATGVATPTRCIYNSQYCLLATTGLVTTAECATLPSTCAGAGSPCSCISASITGGTRSCVSFNFNNLRATTVSTSR